MSNNFIREVPKALRPRERLMEYGAPALSDQELLAILLRTGTSSYHVLDLALTCLQHFDSLNGLKQASLSDLLQIKGIGPVKAVELLAAIELGQRIARSNLPRYGSIHSTMVAGEQLLLDLGDDQQEKLVAIYLTTKNEMIKKKTIFMGTVNSSIAHPREIFKEAVKYPTARIIIGHNHPSGDPTPSQADLIFTRRMIACGDLMGIELLDHIIIGQGRYVSLLETTDIFDSRGPGK